MKRLLTIASTVLLFSTLAFAANVHFVKGPVFLEQDLVVLMTAKLAGLGNGDLLIELHAVGIPVVECVNHGGNASPGQNPGETDVTGSVSIPASEIKNGQVSVAIVTQPPPDPDPAVACPNKNWSASIIEMDFTSAEVIVTQNGVIVLQETVDL